MKSNVRLLLALAALLGLCRVCPGDTFLFDERVDAQQKTEIRYDVPKGCVITGLGFRAAYDNITTMHCRYHRLLPNGRLADPKEVHLGSEADHTCEAKVLLPEGWVVVGFGAAGEPEWDVTLLRVWARPLRGNGTLGQLKTFSDGFKPERGCERQIMLTESDRLLTGAGLRFHHNDIMGVYVRSERLLNLDDRGRSNLQRFTERAWLLDEGRIRNMDRLIQDAGEYGVTRLDVRVTEQRLNSLIESQAPRLSEVLKRLSEEASLSHLWIPRVGAERVGELFRAVPRIQGIVVDFGTLPAQEQTAAGVLEIHGACRKAERRMCLRLPSISRTNEADIPQLLTKMPKDVSLIVPLRVGPASQPVAKAWDLRALGERDVIVELDLAGPTFGHIALPDVRISEMAGHVTVAALNGAKGFIVPLNSGRSYLPDTVNSLGLEALHRLANDPLRPTDTLWRGLCTRRYGAAAEKAEAALRRTSCANDLIFRTLGWPVLWENGRALPIDAADARLRAYRDPSSSNLADRALKELLDPNNKTIERALDEKETALWLTRQSLADGQAALELNTTDQTRSVHLAMEHLDSAAKLSQDVAGAYLLTKVYAVDGSAATRSSLDAVLNRLLIATGQMPPEPEQALLLSGTQDFARSVRDSLANSEKNAELVVALREVKELSDRAQDEEAAKALSAIMTNTRLGPHLSKQNQNVGRLASSLGALWQPSEMLQVVRGGDGQWGMDKIGGRWCWVIGPQKPCLYLDVQGPPLQVPADYVLSFEYFDRGDWRLHFEYDPDYPDREKRQYHPVEPLQLTNTGIWMKAWFDLTNCLFSSGQNLSADMRFISGQGAYIRNIHLERRIPQK